VSRWFLIVGSILLMAGTAVAGWSIHVSRGAERVFQEQAVQAAADAARIRAQVVVYSENRVSPGKTFSESLAIYGVQPATIAAIVGAAQRTYDLRHVRAGNRLFIGRSVVGELRGLRYQIDAGKMLEVKAAGLSFSAAVNEIPSRTQAETISGQIRDSLFNAVADAGESPELAYRLAQIFGYDLDFYTDPRHGDTFRVVVEKTKYLDGKTAGYGRILAAEYDNDGHPYQALLFHDPSGSPAYYSADGKSLQKAFLRSPLKFAAPITSHFSLSRFHPILKTYRPHLGIDYGAPTGTPVQTIGSGKVEFAGRKGGDGNMVRISHASGYETMYLHLSRILVKPGAHVQLGQTIGLVGMTGLATGPHLDFRILQHGEFRNFLALHLPPSDPVARTEWNAFASLRDQWVPLLTAAPESRTAMAQPAEPSPALAPVGSR
jgi:murein DD-endopeptidase MepM/ murein hydrolase activator NlpD